MNKTDKIIFVILALLVLVGAVVTFVSVPNKGLLFLIFSWFALGGVGGWFTKKWFSIKR